MATSAGAGGGDVEAVQAVEELHAATALLRAVEVEGRGVGGLLVPELVDRARPSRVPAISSRAHSPRGADGEVRVAVSERLGPTSALEDHPGSRV